VKIICQKTVYSTALNLVVRDLSAVYRSFLELHSRSSLTISQSYQM